MCGWGRKRGVEWRSKERRMNRGEEASKREENEER